MFSLIICSRNSDISDKLKNNISSTIGEHEYEIIVVDNSENQYNIFQAYNVGVERAKYEFLCFMHEDILYMTDDWGSIVAKDFEDSKVGMLGVVGGRYVGKYQTYWFSSGFNAGQFYDNNLNLWKWPDTVKDSDVVAIDGLWMCVRKKLFDSGIIKWDMETYNGFHFYDMDMSMQVLSSGYSIRLVKDLLIQHISFGKLGKPFWMSCVRFHKKWHSFLPQCANGFVLPLDYKEGLFVTIKGLLKGKTRAILNKWH